MNIQAVSAYTSQLGAAGGATQGASITELAQQHGVSRDSLVQYVQSRIQQTRESNGQPPLDQSTLDQLVDHTLDHDRGEGAGTDQAAPEETPVAGYTADAQRTGARAGVTGTISILA